MSRRLLIVDDDAHGSALLSRFLEGQGYATSVVMNGLHVEPEVRRSEPALVLLDVGLPGIDGLEVCHQLRRFSAVPIIMVSGRVDEIDRTLGLEIGADDYVCKPYSPREIAARIKAHLRRAEGRFTGGAQAWGFRVDEAGRRIACGEEWLALTPQEYRLLRRLLARPGHVVSRDELLDDPDAVASGLPMRAVDSHVKNLRRKLEAAGATACRITAVYGAGYRFDPSLGPG